MANIGASTYNFIASQTVSGSSTATITFSNIPQNYTDLVLVSNARSSRSGFVSSTLVAAFNGDTSSARYSQTLLYGTGSSASSARTTSGNYTGIIVDYVPAASSADGSLGTAVTQIMNYSSNNMYKTWLTKSGDGTDHNMGASVELWQSNNPITSIAISEILGNYITSGSTFTLYGIKAADTLSIIPTKAIGGDLITSDGTYTYHAFKSTGNFIPAQALTVDILTIAGGGGGGQGKAGNWEGGGGGAGGVLATSSQSLTAGTTYACTVGAGGANTASGTNTTMTGGALSLTPAYGGGNGYGGTSSAVPAGNGGSGGGAWYTGPGTGTSGQGNNGAAGNGNSASGGGGGAGGGGGSPSTNTSGNGGAGVNTVTNWGALSSVISVVNIGVGGYVGGGGAGGNGVTGGTATAGGGNGGSGSTATAIGLPGIAYTGGGGGGGASNSNTVGGQGGSGIVIVRYLS